MTVDRHDDEESIIEAKPGEAMLLIGADGELKGAVMPKQVSLTEVNPAARTVARIVAFMGEPKLVKLVDSLINVTPQALRHLEQLQDAQKH